MDTAFRKLSSQTLRQHKGVSFTGITTVFFCHDGRGKLLLQKRGPAARDERGHWDPGAGGLKHGQAVEASLTREVQEEYGVKPKRIDFIGYFDAFRTSTDGMPTHWLAMFFAVLVDPKKVINNEPDMISEIGWFDLDNLPSPMHSQFEPFMKKYGSQLRRLMGLNSSFKSKKAQLDQDVLVKLAKYSK